MMGLTLGQNVSFRNSLSWPIYIINSVNKAKLSCNTPLPLPLPPPPPPPPSSPPPNAVPLTVSLETYPLYLL